MPRMVHQSYSVEPFRANSSIEVDFAEIKNNVDKSGITEGVSRLVATTVWAAKMTRLS